ncbi:peroxide stress protein YaaA [Actinomyces sp. B33]|uniref:YaaA family protein n=1 Tax=Actinomyces sp. B33 TaxID=2942131 RepID=UPI00233FEA7A|nr:peroxide stress protein YaaA [Actinomyces sp. B33]MDC4232993.1 peroxide stress protein YaaA [Actinomyces sp. B33]
MRIWLPPSEGKTPPSTGPALDLDRLVLPGLRDDRIRVIDALSAASARPDALEVLGLGARSAQEIASNLALHGSACAPAARLFTGVLYGAARLDLVAPGALDSLPVRIFSGLFGVVSPADPLPDHRLAMGRDLPGVGSLAAFWRPRLEPALREETGSQEVLDMRSGPYRQACPAPWARVLRVGVVREREGVRRTVSHDAKKWRGLLTRALLAEAPSGEAAEAVDRIARGLRARDASRDEHRVVDVEIDEARATRAGGTIRSVVLVID